MKSLLLGTIVGFLGLMLLSQACQPKKVAEVGLQEPSYFVPVKQEDRARYRPELADLGRHLFYDPILSSDSTVSCSSCHQQDKAFTDGLTVSVGVQGRAGNRNAISLGNVGYRYKGLFWDGKAETLEASVVHPLTSGMEMNSNWPEVLDKLAKHGFYRTRFNSLFRTNDSISRAQVEEALAQFMRSLISANAKFDRVLLEKEQFSALEEQGFQIFFDSAEDLPNAECGHCHTDPLFTSLEYANNGIEAIDELDAFKDVGRYAISGDPFDRGRFRVPSLRNVALTAPYMHDGRFQTLEEVVDHYASGGHPQINTSPNVRKLQLDDEHKRALVAFLHTLTDSVFITASQFSNPFEAQFD